MYPHQDRSPLICPAGVKHVREWSVPDCLQEYSLQEKLDVVIKGFKKEPPPVVKTKLNPIRYAGIYTEIKNVLTPEPPSGFKMLLEDLGETTYHSYWNKPLGKLKIILLYVNQHYPDFIYFFSQVRVVILVHCCHQESPMSPGTLVNHLLKVKRFIQ